MITYIMSKSNNDSSKRNIITGAKKTPEQLQNSMNNLSRGGVHRDKRAYASKYAARKNKSAVKWPLD